MDAVTTGISNGISYYYGQIFFIKEPNRSFERCLTALHQVLSSSTPREAVEHQMSLLAILLTSLFFFSGFAVAGISAPGCLASLEWVCILSHPLCILVPLSDDSDLLAPRSDIQQFWPRSVRGRSVPAVDMRRGLSVLLLTLPVLRTLSVHEICRLIPFSAATLLPLPAGYSYGGPSGPDDADLCECNTVVYSLISACDACQGEKWFTYDCHRFIFSDPWTLPTLSWPEYAYNCTRVTTPGT